MASFDENGKYIKTNWKAGDKITATKLNKIEESIEAVNDNDISRHVEADARLDALEAKDVAHDKEFTNVKNLIKNAEAAAELGDYEINSRMQFLEDDVEQAVTDMNNAVTTIRNEIAEVEGLKAVDEAIQNDMTNAQTQTFAVTDAYKFTVDHDGMMSSLATLNNIEGLSSVDVNALDKPILVSRYLKNICTVDFNKNYFEDAVYLHSIGDCRYTKNGTTVNITGTNAWSCIDFEVPALVEGKKYCVLFDNVIVNSGASAAEMRYYVTNENADYAYIDEDTLSATMHGNVLNESGFNMIFTCNNHSKHTLRLHCSLQLTSGDVTYENIQIYEVKEMIVPDIQLNSLPNSVKDKIKDGVYIKRVSDTVRLDSLEWIASSTNSSTSQFRVYYTNSLSDVAWPVVNHDGNANPNSILCDWFDCVCQNVALSSTQTEPEYMISGITRNLDKSEIRVKVYSSDAPDLASFKTWLTSNNVTMQYELENPIYTDVNMTIKVDKGDTVVINTTKTMDLTYDIQLNTRAQIDTMQTNINHHVHSEYIPLSGGNVTGTIKPASGCYCDLGSSENAWINIYSYPFNMFVEDNGYTSQLKANRGNFRLVDGYGTSVFSWSHDYYIMGPDVTNQINLGSADFRFKSLYLNAQPNVSSDRTLKENIKYVNSNESNVTYEDMYTFVKDDLELATYNLVEHDKLNMGFIAQDLLVNLDGTDNKVGQMIVNPVAVPTEEDIEEGTPYPTLSYDTGMYTSVLAGALKEAINKIEQLEARINELENK